MDDTQAIEPGQDVVLLVMHDGPNLTTQMENSLNDAEQMIANSTYTMVLRCRFD